MRRLSVLLACVVMALTLIAIAVASGASAAPKQQVTPQNHFYGALDYSTAKSALYWGHGTSKTAANQAAYNTCQKAGATDCQTVVWVYNGWLASAQSSKFFDVGWGPTKQWASGAAVTRCQSGPAPPCKAYEWWHTAIDPNKQARGGYTLPGP
jgi:Domain of unknown function (DUF4189)